MLQMFVLFAVKHDPRLKEYYERKKGKSKNAMLFLNNVK